MEKVIKKREFFKQKVAIFFGYNGFKFHGLQKNINVRTIEGEIEKALYDCELIPSANFGEIKKIGWQRSARTDKGVHAVANVISLKLAISDKFMDLDKGILQVSDNLNAEKEGNLEEEKAIEKPEVAKKGKEEEEDDNENEGVDKSKINFKKIVNMLNSILDQDIRVFNIRRTTRNFDSRSQARTRSYEYIVPIEVFYAKENQPKTEEEEKNLLAQINTLSSKLKGSHRFHNFSRRLKPTDPKAWRVVIDINSELITAKDLVETTEQQSHKMIKFTIKGQSFVYNQIRKMIGLIIEIVQKGLPENHIDVAFEKEKIKTWLAPAEGLLLNRVTFEGYNNKQQIPEKLEYTKEEEEAFESYKREKIYPLVLNAELANKCFTEWLKKSWNSEGKEEDDDEEMGGGADDD